MMTRDEERAREIVESYMEKNGFQLVSFQGQHSKDLVAEWTHHIAQALARERREENEACAKIVEKTEFLDRCKGYGCDHMQGLPDCLAAAIRARQSAGQGEK